MVEWVIIVGLSWFGYEQHERAVEAEQALGTSEAQVVQLNKVVKVWEDKHATIEKSNREFEESIRKIERKNAEQAISLEKLGDDKSRDYLNTTIPACVYDIITEGGNGGEDSECESP